MAKKKLDERIRTLIQNNVFLGHRSFFVLIGDNGRSQLVNLNFILGREQTKGRTSVLWCYKKELELSSNEKKRMGQYKKLKLLGNAASNSGESENAANPKENPFEQFITQTDIRYCYYKDTESILGNTFDMCVLQVKLFIEIIHEYLLIYFFYY